MNSKDTNRAETNTEGQKEKQQNPHESQLLTQLSDKTLTDPEEMATLNGDVRSASISDPSDTSSRFNALVKDRDNLREEVIKLRKSLEELRSKHESQDETVQDQLQEARNEKEEWENRYNELKDGLDDMRSRLAERFKAKIV